MSTTDVIAVSFILHSSEKLWGGSIDTPQAGSQSEGHAIEIAGWVLGKGSPVVAVELVHGGNVVRRVPVNLHRPDVAAVYPAVPGAEQSGFRTSVSVLGLAELELLVQAVLQDQQRVPLGRICARRRWREEAAGGDVGLVSVVIPCYNQAQFLGEAIESVIEQTYPHVEVVVVDDGSTDNTAEVAARYPGVQCIHQENQGLAAARNSGLAWSRGEYLVFLDADDRLLPEALQTGLAYLQAHPDCVFAAGHYRLITIDGAVLGERQPHGIETEHYAELLRRNYIAMHATVMYRRTVFEAVGEFDTLLKACEDYDLYLRIARNFPIYCYNTLVAEYRRHGENMSRDPRLMLSTSIAVLRSQWKHVTRNDHFKEAYEAGLKFWQESYGEELAEEVSAHMHQRKLEPALRGLWILLRHDPQRLAALISSKILPAHTPYWLRLSSPRPSSSPGSKVHFGSLRRLQPISRVYGYDRGLPLDRYYIENFLARNAHDIHGRVLEIGDDSYTRRFGSERVTTRDVLHVVEGNPQATFVGDLACADHIPSDAFDCVILTQTLNLIYDVRPAVKTIHRILKPGGVLLVTVPGISQIGRDEWAKNWCWRFTSSSIRRLFEEFFPTGNVQVEAHGNVLAATAFLQGLTVGELDQEELDYRDPDYDVVITLRSIKPEVHTGITQSQQRGVELNSKPLVSSIVIFLNAEKFIQEAIESVLAQTYDNWELLLVDDGSTDGSTAIALRYAEQYPKRVHYLEHPGHQNRGKSAARNLGISHARGEYIAFLDADDVWLPHKLEQQVEILDSQPEAAMLYGRTQVWYSWTGNPEDSQRDYLTEPGVPLNTLAKPPTLFLLMLQDEGTVPSPSNILVRHGFIKAAGGFEESFPNLHEDMVFYAKIFLEAPVYVAGECWHRYRQHGNNSAAIATKAGQWHPVHPSPARHIFLNWLTKYVSARGINDVEVQNVLKKELRPYRYPDARVEVVHVSLSIPNSEQLWGGNIDVPVPGIQTYGHSVGIAGWVLGRSCPATAVELIQEGRVLRRSLLGMRRPDVATAYPDVAGVERSGFQAVVGVRRKTTSELLVQVVLQDESRVPLGVVHVRRIGRLRPERPLNDSTTMRQPRPAWKLGGLPRQRFLVLLYHRIAESLTEPWAMNVTPENFIEQMEIVRQYTQPLPLQQAIQTLNDGNLPERSVVVTFDDGYACNLYNARPVLERCNIPATVFLPIRAIGEVREFWWDELDRLLLQPGALPEMLQLRVNGSTYQWALGEAAHYSEEDSRRDQDWRAWEEAPTARHALYRSLWELLLTLPDAECRKVLDKLLAWADAEPVSRPTHRTLSLEEVSALIQGELIEIGAHTVTHTALSALPADSQRDEIQKSKARLEDILARSVTSFAYPYGRQGHYTAETVALVQEAGFTCACSNFGGVVEKSTDRFQLPRVFVQDWDGEEFKRHLSRWFHAR